MATRATRKELAYEALLASGRTRWSAGDRIRVYRATGGRAALFPQNDAEAAAPHDYDTHHYVRELRETFAACLARAGCPPGGRSTTSRSQVPTALHHSIAPLGHVLAALCAVRPDRLEPGDTLLYVGKQPPCVSCIAAGVTEEESGIPRVAHTRWALLALALVSGHLWAAQPLLWADSSTVVTDWASRASMRAALG